MTDTDTSRTERRFTMPCRDAVAQVRNTGGTAASTLPLFDPGDVSSKRVSGGIYHGVRGSLLTLCYVADIDTSWGPRNPIALAEAPETRGTLANWHTRKFRLCHATRCSYCRRVDQVAFCYNSTAHRRRARRPGTRTSSPMKSASFWYPDGNIVIKADATYCKLHRSRLARYCVYFKKLFADDTDDHEDRCAKVEGCPVYGQTEPESDVAAVVKYVCMSIGADRNLRMRLRHEVASGRRLRAVAVKLVLQREPRIRTS